MSNHIDITGQRCNKLVAIQYIGKSYWLCRCDCGNYTRARIDRFTRKTRIGCSCATYAKLEKTHVIPMISKTFTYLTVLRYDKKSKPKYRRYICKCKCGNIKSVSGAALRSNLTKSCGCLQTQMFLAKQLNLELTEIPFELVLLQKTLNSFRKFGIRHFNLNR